MQSTKYNMAELHLDMKYLKDKVHKIDTCLNGDDSNPESLGLIHLVMKNTSFRQKVAKFLYTTWIAIATVTGKVVFDWFNKKGI